jgi:hypothetical protein
MNVFLRGTATIDSWNNWKYDKIRKVNIVLQKLPEGILTEEEKNPLLGQALFFRAWLYTSMVQGYGGVPLILEPQEVDDPELFPVRASSSECFAQITKDLDDAIALLPTTWSGADYGRVDKLAALAFKGRVALLWASPLFNPNGDADRWTAAYNANKAAKDAAESAGKELVALNDIWYSEVNNEAIMVRRYNNPGSTYFVGGTRQTGSWGKDRAGDDQPTLHLVNSFPMKDGTPFTVSTKEDYITFWKDRDPRLYTSVAYNGSNPGYKDMVEASTYLWEYTTKNGWNIPTITHPTSTGFFRQKAQDSNVSQSTVGDAAVDWIEIRFAEVLMNYGEAANGAGKPEEALQVLRDIRERAGIEAGDGNYGITATSKEEIAEAYFNERFIEFALEGKRWSDIRRLRKFNDINAQERRWGIRFAIKDDVAEADWPKGLDDITDSAVYMKFNVDSIVSDVKMLPHEKFNIKDEYYFYAIPKTHIDKNSKLEQTLGWDGGTFDPLK